MDKHAPEQKHSIEYTAWAMRANGRWIVHGGLSTNADHYIRHLEKNDKPRLDLSCRNAYLMVWQRNSMEDPKPWFYGGLFSLATPDEMEKFIAGHWLTKMLLIPDGEEFSANIAPGVSDLTLDKIQRLREAMAKLPDSP